MTSDRAAKYPGAGDRGEQFPGYRGALNANCVTIAQVLKPAGYRTAAAGKWHVGDSEPPNKRGFDDFYGFVGGYGVDSWEPRMMTRLPEGRPQRQYKTGEYFATDAITDHALDFLTDMRKAGAPWLLLHRVSGSTFPCAIEARRHGRLLGSLCPGLGQNSSATLGAAKENRFDSGEHNANAAQPDYSPSCLQTTWVVD